jgi:hypothetical protein
MKFNGYETPIEIGIIVSIRDDANGTHTELHSIAFCCIRSFIMQIAVNEKTCLQD